MQELYNGLNNSGKYVIPKNASYSCGDAAKQNSWYYDVDIHYKQFERCTFIEDTKDKLLLQSNALSDTDKCFK